MGDKTFLVAFFGLMSIVTPFLYYTAIVHQWMVQNKPEGYKLPVPKQLWMTGVGMVTFAFMKEMLDCISFPIFRRLIVKIPGQEAKWERSVDKAARNLVGFVYFTISTYWGWCMMKDSKWIPSYLGG